MISINSNLYQEALDGCKSILEEYERDNANSHRRSGEVFYTHLILEPVVLQFEMLSVYIALIDQIIATVEMSVVYGICSIIADAINFLDKGWDTTVDERHGDIWCGRPVYRHLHSDIYKKTLSGWENFSGDSHYPIMDKDEPEQDEFHLEPSRQFGDCQLNEGRQLELRLELLNLLRDEARLRQVKSMI